MVHVGFKIQNLHVCKMEDAQGIFQRNSAIKHHMMMMDILFIEEETLTEL